MAGNVQWPYYSSVNTTQAASSTSESGVMGKDQFLKILITQLQNQDPGAPMQDREFIAQMAQFSSLEQMMNMTSQLQQLRQSLGIASGMIGLEVEWNTFDSKGQLAGSASGVVQSIVVQDDKQFAEIDGKLIDVKDIFAMRMGSGGE